MIFPQNVNFFGDDTSLFSVVNKIHISATTLNQDLNLIKNWTLQWKMILTLKQALEVTFNIKIKKLLHPTLLFNNIPLGNSLFQKHLVLTLNIK